MLLTPTEAVKNGFSIASNRLPENRLSLDQHCNTGAPGVFFFEVIPTLSGIKPGALLIVDFGARPLTGLWCSVSGTRIQDHAIATTPKRCLQNSISWITSGLYLMTMRTGWRSGALRTLCTVAKLAMRQPFVLFKGLTFQKLCLQAHFARDHHNKMLRLALRSARITSIPLMVA